jgi:uncharacterized protein YcfL
MKKVFLIIAAVGMFACTSNETQTENTDSVVTDSMDVNDSINLDQVKQMDSLYSEGKI